MIDFLFILIFLIFYFFYANKLTNRSKILLIRLPNWLGDTLMVYPTLNALKKTNIPFICIGHPWAIDLFSGTDIKIVSYSNIRNPIWIYYICTKYITTSTYISISFYVSTSGYICRR